MNALSIMEGNSDPDNVHEADLWRVLLWICKKLEKLDPEIIYNFWYLAKVITDEYGVASGSKLEAIVNTELPQNTKLLYIVNCENAVLENFLNLLCEYELFEPLAIN